MNKKISDTTVNDRLAIGRAAELDAIKLFKNLKKINLRDLTEDERNLYSQRSGVDLISDTGDLVDVKSFDCLYLIQVYFKPGNEYGSVSIPNPLIDTCKATHLALVLQITPFVVYETRDAHINKYFRPTNPIPIVNSMLNKHTTRKATRSQFNAICDDIRNDFAGIITSGCKFHYVSSVDSIRFGLIKR
jgi:hypothetical protein